MSEMTKKTSGAKKLKPNIIDFLIIIVIIGAVIGIVLRMGILEKVSINNSLESVRVSFLVQDINDASESCFNKGDKFYSRTHKCALGTLETFIPRAAEAFISNESGQVIKTESNNHRIDVIGTLICEGIFTEEGFLLGGINYIAPGSIILVDSPNIVVSLTVTDIQQIERTN